MLRPEGCIVSPSFYFLCSILSLQDLHNNNNFEFLSCILQLCLENHAVIYSSRSYSEFELLSVGTTMFFVH